MHVARRTAVNFDFSSLPLHRRILLAVRVLRAQPTVITHCTVWWGGDTHGEYALDVRATDVR